MRFRFAMAALFAAALVFAPRPAAAQAPPAAGEPLRVFIDCSHRCDEDFLKTEVNWVDYMRDRADAQVHVLVTTQSTGGGGERYTLNFIGLKEFAAQVDTLVVTTTSEDTDDTRRRRVTKAIALGLVPFVARTPQGERLAISLAQTAAGAPVPAAPAAPAADPWNFWTFSIGMNGFGQGESQSGSYNLSGNVSANRTTENWKINNRLSGRYSESKFEYTIDDVDYKTVSINKNYGLSSLVAKSLGPHLSAGVRASVSTSSYGNTSLGFSVTPAVEYNFIPYSESTRRSMILRYTTGVRYADYREVTIYGEEQETRPVHELDVEYGTTQPWGRVYLSLNGSQYLHDTKKYNAGIGGSTEVRIFKGFSFNVGGNYSRVRDQLALPGRDLTEEEILLQQRQLATSYNYFISAGISYRFGSIFNSVVNPRFGGGGGGGMVIYM